MEPGAVYREAKKLMKDGDAIISKVQDRHNEEQRSLQMAGRHLRLSHLNSEAAVQGKPQTKPFPRRDYAKVKVGSPATVSGMRVASPMRLLCVPLTIDPACMRLPNVGSSVPYRGV